MKWLKAGIVGAIGALIMYICMELLIAAGVSPINILPSSAFLKSVGGAAGVLGTAVHFLYGMFWSAGLVVIFEYQVGALKGVKLSVFLWLVMMAIFSPMSGWGFFGLGGRGHELAQGDPLFIGSSVQYVVITLALHVVYGAIIGWLNARLIPFGRPVTESVHPLSPESR
jgi:hypothetical protein